MDHIPLPLGVAHGEDDEVPYLVKTDHRYDGQGFEGFLARKGFTICREDGESTTCVGRLQSNGDVSFDHAVSLVQSCLYFGILQEMAKALRFSITLDNSDKTKANGAKIINSQGLTGVISQFALFELDQVEAQTLFEARRVGSLDPTSQPCYCPTRFLRLGGSRDQIIHQSPACARSMATGKQEFAFHLLPRGAAPCRSEGEPRSSNGGLSFAAVSKPADGEVRVVPKPDSAQERAADLTCMCLLSFEADAVLPGRSCSLHATAM